MDVTVGSTGGPAFARSVHHRGRWTGLLPPRSVLRPLPHRADSNAEVSRDNWPLRRQLDSAQVRPRTAVLAAAYRPGTSADADPFASPMSPRPLGEAPDEDEQPTQSSRRGRKPGKRLGGSSASTSAPATELIWMLERRGEGWGEEIIPHITLEQRPLEKKQRIRQRSSMPDPWTARLRRRGGEQCPLSSSRAAPHTARLHGSGPCQWGSSSQASSSGGWLAFSGSNRAVCSSIICRATPTQEEPQLSTVGHPPPSTLKQADVSDLDSHAAHMGASRQPAPVPASSHEAHPPKVSQQQQQQPQQGPGSPAAKGGVGHVPEAAVKPKRARSKPLQEGSAEFYLRDTCGIPEDKVNAVMNKAVAWRFTPGGRPLIDRRRRSRVERNMRVVAQHLIEDCGVAAGERGVGAIFQRIPQIMLCKPTLNDRWDRRVVELAAFLHEHGHCNVPEDWSTAPEMAAWVKRQRVARAQGALTEERLQILEAMGFEFGEVAQLTEEWEQRFDQLVDWFLWKESVSLSGHDFDWVGINWGLQGGPQAREVALWTQLQREFRRRNLLPTEAIRRLDAVGFRWEPEGGQDWERAWMWGFGRLLYVVERNKQQQLLYLQQQAAAAKRTEGPDSPEDALVPPPRQPSALDQAPLGLAGGGSLDDVDIITGRRLSRVSLLGGPAPSRAGQQMGPVPLPPAQQGSPVPLPRAGLQPGAQPGPSALPGLQPGLQPGGGDYAGMVGTAQSPGMGRRRGAAPERRQRLAGHSEEEIAARRAALVSAKLDPGLGFWLAKQRWQWRFGFLPQEQQTMLELAGVEMDIYAPAQWKAMAHEAAKYLNGCQIGQDLFEQESQAARGASNQVQEPIITIQSPQQERLPQLDSPQQMPPQAAAFQAVRPADAQQHPQAAAASALSQPGATTLRSAQPAEALPAGRASAVLSDAFASNGSSGSSSRSSSTAVGSGHPADGVAGNGTVRSGDIGSSNTSGSATPISSAASAALKEYVDPQQLPPVGRPPSRRMAVVRWVLTQKALWEERRLSSVQVRYMTLLGLTWILSDEVLHMRESLWRNLATELEHYLRQSDGREVAVPERLFDWLAHQKGLYAMGFLSWERVARLSRLGISWAPQRTQQDRMWDRRLTELLSFRREKGHCQVPENWPRNQRLGRWLVEQKALWRAGALPVSRIAQLRSLGVEAYRQ